MNYHHLNALLQDGAIAPWNQITAVNTDSDDIGTISEEEQTALDAFYGRFTTIALADDAAAALADDAAATLADDDAAAVIIDKTATIDTFTSDSESAAVVKVPRKKKLPEVSHTEVQVNEPRQDGNDRHIFAQYMAHTLQPNGEEYDTEQKSVTFHFKRYKNQEKRPKTAAYKAKDSTIHNYGMVYKPGCPCNFTRVARFILEHPNHLFKNGTPIPENLTILYYDNI
jgi:hypothetical protein